ncbi:hypothetical protein ASPZODRAFT_1932953 [Penicilliopsis zonata CBS 506.65]|uniref:Uncharacterized protein n=1 Tax=Penicilliopsis zonata CBS 506.65 TaxID=1073090 RepID=A0A1L9SJ91_9EURO|nr:hypothetical protein ASPZODRAFT_1932953 [Penicilliopsis zonata CBS 506.65]OJJ47268.1 hypothetical protein ASPZODRAFT_1932953 [Penicilliopsis zonata CBS 506.65]
MVLDTMPLFHSRRYSWPYCGDPRVSTDPGPPKQGVRNKEQLVSHSPFSNPVLAATLFDHEDDAVSAGIDRSKTARSHHHHHHHRLWPNTGKEEKSSQVVSTITEASESPGAVLRRMIRPPLEKARSLFVLPSMGSEGGYNNMNSDKNNDNDNKVVISYWVESHTQAQAKQMAVLDLDDDMLLVPGGRWHRRCHSEQPRSWKEPSASLFTLVEEG